MVLLLTRRAGYREATCVRSVDRLHSFSDGDTVWSRSFERGVVTGLVICAEGEANSEGPCGLVVVMVALSGLAAGCSGTGTDGLCTRGVAVLRYRDGPL